MTQSFKMPAASAAAAYDMGVKIFGRNGIPTDNGLKNLLAATREELKLPADIVAETVIDLSILKEAQRDLGIGKVPLIHLVFPRQQVPPLLTISLR